MMSAVVRRRSHGKKHLFFSLSFTLATTLASANSIADYETRRHDYLLTAAPINNDNSLPMQAYLGLPLNPDALDRALAKITTPKNADFEMAKLIRVLFYTKSENDKILDVLKQVPLGLTQGERKHQYWSENHMLLWMSSAWLLHEKFNWDLPNPNLRKQLVHFLSLKINDGFYEFFSPSYFPYLLSGLLNLADFAEDKQIQHLATQTAQRLIKTCLLFVNNKGVFFPATGRAYASKYTYPYLQNHARLIYLITGLGRKQHTPSQIGGFIATTHLDMSDIINSFQASVDQILHNGHPLSANKHSTLNRLDRTLFQWSSGAYFHPDTINDTLWLMNTMDLWDHAMFKQHAGMANLPASIAQISARHLNSFTRSSLITASQVALYKDHGVALSSIQNLRKGHQGYQQWPWVAAIDDLAVWTQSGEVTEHWNSRSNTFANASLPYIQQKHNLILIMYRANTDLKLLARNNHSVTLHWPNTFDESIEQGHWLIGRRGQSYIAVHRHCDHKINSHYACDDQDGQTWAAIVGNASTHKNFDAFINDATQAHVEDAWTWDPKRLAYNYHGKLEYHGETLEKIWH